ncbi:MAG: hypothetical protein KY462_16415 [Actinobacteria bacterium]|nr:hypothetical protein [Actinomycetota bacterium]
MVSGIEQGLFVLRPNLATTGSSPTAEDINTSTDQNTSVMVSLRGTDVDSCELTFANVASPAHGTLSIGAWRSPSTGSCRGRSRVTLLGR